MKKLNLTSIILGILIGILFSSIYFFSNNDYSYFELSEDVNVTGIGNLKKGTLLKYDNSYPEGFTRFILYLNSKNVDLKKTSKKDKIIPYWIEKKE